MDPSQIFPLVLLGIVVLALGVMVAIVWPRPRSRPITMPISGRLNSELYAAPLVKAATLPSGFVQVAGAAQPTATLRTPVWGVECVAWRAEILSWKMTRRRSAGALQDHELTTMGVVHAETGAVPFDVVDETGRVRIEADQRVRMAVSLGRTSSRGLLSRLTPEAQAYLDRVMDMIEGSVEVRECWVPVGARCQVAGHASPAAGAAPPRLQHGEREIIIGD